MDVYADLHVNMCSFALFLSVIIIVQFLFCGSFPSPGSILHMTVNENSPLPFSESRVEEVFASDGEEVSTTSVLAIYYNHTLVIGSIHSGLTVYQVCYLMYMQSRLMDCYMYMQRSKLTFIHLFIRTLLKCTIELISKHHIVSLFVSH